MNTARPSTTAVSTMPEAVLFFVFGALALAGALGVVLMRNPVHSALSLVSVLISIAVLFIIQDAQLLAAVQVIVYAGAIVVLFLFVIMLLGVDRHESLHDPVKSQRPLAIAVGVVSVAAFVVLGNANWTSGDLASRGVLHPVGTNNVKAVADSLFTTFLWPFELTAVLLVIAVIGGVVLARRSHLPASEELTELEEQDTEADIS